MYKHTHLPTHTHTRLYFVGVLLILPLFPSLTSSLSIQVRSSDEEKGSFYWAPQVRKHLGMN